MAKKETKPKKPREIKYEEKLKVNTSLENLINIALQPKKKKK